MLLRQINSLGGRLDAPEGSGGWVLVAAVFPGLRPAVSLLCSRCLEYVFVKCKKGARNAAAESGGLVALHKDRLVTTT